MSTRLPQSKGRSESHSVYLVALVAIIAGGILIWLSWQVEEAQDSSLHQKNVASQIASADHAPETNDGALTNPVNTQAVLPVSNATIGPGWTNKRWRLVSKGLGDLGLALISIGGIALLLEMRVMSDYFQGKIARSMTGREYLKKLTKDQLEELQADALRAYWGVEERDREDLLYYCRDQVQSFIAEPFREDVHGTFTIKRIDDKSHDVEETISYTCRAIRGEIQREVKWTNRNGEINEIKRFRIEITVPNACWPEINKRYPFTEQRQVYEAQIETAAADASSPVNRLTENLKRKFKEFVGQPELEKLKGDRIGYKLSLDAYRHIDMLHVSVQTRYRAPVGRSLTWQMTHPSKKVTGVINFEDVRFYLEPFGVNDHNLHPENKLPEDSPHTFVYDSWLLPESGFVFHLLPRGESATS